MKLLVEHGIEERQLIVNSFFFKQKTAYEIQYGLVGSEMCIRDRFSGEIEVQETEKDRLRRKNQKEIQMKINENYMNCLLYTSDAADERSSVDLGGRRIIKKKKHTS